MPRIPGFCIGCKKPKTVRVSRISRDPRGICSDCELRANPTKNNPSPTRKRG